MHNDMEYWLTLITSIAEKAYSEVKNIVGTKLGSQPVSGITRGAGGDITLKIDEISEKVIKEELSQIEKEVILITEEAGEIQFNLSQDRIDECEDFLSVDPIDGSHNAAMGFPLSAISIAHATSRKLSEIDCAVILNIFNGDMYTAIKGKGAKKNGTTIHVNNHSNIVKSMFGISLSLNEPLYEFAQRYKFIFQTPLKIRSIGSNALGFALLAEGALDTFLDLQKKSRTFDIAAGYLILKEAGGYVWDLKGNSFDGPLDIETRVSFIGVNAGLRSYIENLIPEFIKAFEEQPKFNDDFEF